MFFFLEAKFFMRKKKLFFFFFKKTWRHERVSGGTQMFILNCITSHNYPRVSYFWFSPALLPVPMVFHSTTTWHTTSPYQLVATERVSGGTQMFFLIASLATTTRGCPIFGFPQLCFRSRWFSVPQPHGTPLHLINLLQLNE